ncbi:MAG: LacI family DNA-binding transcriptional regulator [Steroidobacteraceae bacterium]
MSRPRPGRRAPAEQSSAITLDMVAREAGVSPSTVSRILNGTARVRESKVRDVEAAIAKFRFSPNPVARSLARGRSMSVGVVTQALASPYYGTALAAIEKRLLRAGYAALFVSGHGREEDERKCVEHLLSRRVEGIILLTSGRSDAELSHLSGTVPLVVTGRSVAGERLCCLDVDSTSGARLAVEYLLGLGHRRIAMIAGAAGRADAAQRLAGYRAALAAAKVPYDRKLVVPGQYTERGGYAAMDALLTSGASFTAVFAANDQSAVGALLALHRHGRRVPRDVSVVGYDDLPSSAYTIPPLTTIHRSTEEVGEMAAEAIIDLVEGRPVRTHVPAPTLAVRESARPLRS